VEHLVEQKVASGQLRDAPLTLRDLDRITEEFVRVMSGVYHNRLDYPSATGGITSEFGKP
jgi:membrane-associated HD superfamily phosphohydrolase